MQEQQGERLDRLSNGTAHSEPRTGAYRVVEIEPVSDAYAHRRLLVDERHVGE
jgi:hypothetical protein